MRGNNLLDKMELVDPAYVEAAENAYNKKNNAWVKWVVAAACLCVVILGAAKYGEFLTRHSKPKGADEDTQTLVEMKDSIAYGFTLCDMGGEQKRRYFPVMASDRQHYGLISDDATGLNQENEYVITAADLGSLMGTVAECGNENLNGCKVYHFAKYPEYVSICIVDTPDGYAFYTGGYRFIGDVPIGTSLESVIKQLGIDEPVSMEIFAAGDVRVAEINDMGEIETILEILLEKENIGLLADEQLFAKKWQEVYCNDDVTFNGNTVVYKQKGSAEEDTELYNKSRELWDKDERVLNILCSNGLEIAIDYRPVVGNVISADWYCELSEEEIQMLNQLLGISE